MRLRIHSDLRSLLRPRLLVIGGTRLMLMLMVMVGGGVIGGGAGGVGVVYVISW